jgi:hypothetical protein
MLEGDTMMHDGRWGLYPLQPGVYYTPAELMAYLDAAQVIYGNPPFGGKDMSKDTILALEEKLRAAYMVIPEAFTQYHIYKRPSAWKRFTLWVGRRDVSWCYLILAVVSFYLALAVANAARSGMLGQGW